MPAAAFALVAEMPELGTLSDEGPAVVPRRDGRRAVLTQALDSAVLVGKH